MEPFERQSHAMPSPPRAFGVRLIIACKAVKALVMLALAIALTIAPAGAARAVETAVKELAAHRAAFTRLDLWMQTHLTIKLLRGAALLAWLDAIATAVECVLLYIGKPWGEWLVILGLTSLLPLELYHLGRRPGPGKLLVLVANAAIVAYLFRRRFKERGRSTPPSNPRSAR